MQLKDKLILEKMLKYVNSGINMLEKMPKEEFFANEVFQNAMAMTVIKVGEMVKNLDFEIRKQNPQVAWKDIAGFRDVIAHRYEVIRMDDLYITVKKDFPALKWQIEKILETEE